MTINGTMSITTYFILNKKDRTGKGQVRPFQLVLEAMKKKETEEAKVKQSSSLKGGTIPNPAPTMHPVVPPKENGFIEFPPPPAAAPAPIPTQVMVQHAMPAAPMEIPLPVKPIRYEDVSASHIQNSITKNKIPDEHQMRTSEMMSEQYDSTKPSNRQLQRSRACELL